MLNICEVFPIRKNLIRNIVQTPVRVVSPCLAPGCVMHQICTRSCYNMHRLAPAPVMDTFALLRREQRRTDALLRNVKCSGGVGDSLCIKSYQFSSVCARICRIMSIFTGIGLSLAAFKFSSSTMFHESDGCCFSLQRESLMIAKMEDQLMMHEMLVAPPLRED